MEDIYEEIVKLKRKGETAALATVTHFKGSTPREDAKMLVRQDGSIAGTIGGGKLEKEVREAAMEVIKEGKSRLLHFDMSGKQAAEGGMICGGDMDVFVEPIVSPSSLYIFGAGHISQSLSRVGKMVGFRVVVVDDRAEFANRERFPEADEVLVENLKAVSSRLEPNPSSYVVIVTRGHMSDEEVLQWAVGTKARYIGMIGSKNKVGTVFSHLKSRGIRKETLAHVHAPIGLDIGAETPEEIAVAIMAEIIQEHRSAGSLTV